MSLLREMEVFMKIQVFSIHPLFDNRINRHLTTLLKNNHQVEYINVSKSNKREFELGTKVILHHINEPFVKSNFKGVIKAWFILHKYLMKGNADIVHIHDALLIPLLYYAKKMNINTVYDKHESYETMGGINARIGTIFEKIFIKYIDSVVYVNEQQRKYIDNMGYKLTRMIPNYQSTETYNIEKKQTDDDKRIQIIYIGSLKETDRNILLMLDIMDEVMDNCPNIKFIVGGSTDNKQISNKILYLSHKFNGFEYKGVMKYSDVIDTTVNSDIGLLFAKDCPNNQASSPNKIYEYMVSGVALVGMGNFMHANEINEYAGKIFSFNTERNEISSYIISLIKDIEQLNRFKENANIMGKKYTWESVEGRYQEIYETIQTKS